MSAAGSAGVVIERAQPQDAAVLHEIARQTFVHATPPEADPASIEQFVATSLSEEAFRGHLDSPASRVLIARRDGEAIGYALLLLDRPLPQGEGIDPAQEILTGRGLFLSKFYLLPQARGTGASSALLEQCLETSRRIGADVLWLQVNDQNQRANAFYERQGLVRVGTAEFQLGAQLHHDFLRARRL